MNHYELEMILVASLIKDTSVLMTVDITPEEFSFPDSREIYSAIIEMESAGEAIDLITVAERVRSNGDSAGWIKAISDWMMIATPSNAKAYAGSVRAAHVERAIAGIAKTLGDNAKNGQDAADAAIRDLMELGHTRRNFDHSVTEAMRLAVDKIEEAMDAKGIVGISSGLADIDDKLGGWHNSDLIIIGARPAMGKTALALNFALGANCSVGVISAEQGAQQIGSRIIAIHGRVNTKNMRNGDMDEVNMPRMHNAVSSLASREIQIYDKPAPTLTDIQRQARKWKHRHDIKAIYVDYIQRIKIPGTGQRHAEIGDIAMGLKELARELDIPVIAAAQVKRDVETRNDKRPMMSDLKESGVLEQEADVIAMLYRDEVYNEKSEHIGIAEINFVKNRHGPIGFVRTAWQAEFLRFDDLYNGNDGH